MGIVQMPGVRVYWEADIRYGLIASTLPAGQNYKVYADNLFTSVPLLINLFGCEIHFVGTVHSGCVPSLRLAEEKELKKTNKKTRKREL